MLRHRTRLVSPRSSFYLLTNVDEHPEALSIANSIITEHIEEAEEFLVHASKSEWIEQAPQSLPDLIAILDRFRSMHVTTWHESIEELSQPLVKHSLTQFAPTALLVGCWLQNVLRAPMAATSTGAMLAKIYKYQQQKIYEENNFVSEYQEVHRLLAFTLPDVSSRSFADNPLFEEFSFEVPLFLLSIGQFPRTYLAELLGVNLGWHFSGLNAVGPILVRKGQHCHSSTKDDTCIQYWDRSKLGCELALDAAIKTLAERSNRDRDTFFFRICVGALIITNIWKEWASSADCRTSNCVDAIKTDMIRILCQKAPHAIGYHGNRLIDGAKIDSLLSSENFRPAEILERLANSEFIVPGKPEDSLFYTNLVRWGGPMHLVFSPTELETISAWILTLSSASETHETDAPEISCTDNNPSFDGSTDGMMHLKSEFVRRSKENFSKCSIREIYHYLLNIEQYPEILPYAEQFAYNRLSRSMAALNSHIRPIPSQHYCPEILEYWVSTQHREQVNAYRSLKGEPSITKEAFINSSVQLAPLILIDGAWLQGMLIQNCIHSEYGRILFQILYEETGEGDVTRHHANVYRELLHEMGIKLPAIETREFIQWTRLLDSSFEIPVFWLSVSCFPRHFMPEILGLNLAVELAGVGGPYMQARDTLRHFKLPTLFVDIHLAADNISQGHTAKSLLAIKLYMDQIAAREGPHNLDSTWRRIWSGVRSTLPQPSLPWLISNTISARLRGKKADELPRIFSF